MFEINWKTTAQQNKS